jgi:hypothetical protein
MLSRLRSGHVRPTRASLCRRGRMPWRDVLDGRRDPRRRRQCVPASTLWLGVKRGNWVATRAVGRHGAVFRVRWVDCWWREQWCSCGIDRPAARQSHFPSQPYGETQSAGSAMSATSRRPCFTHAALLSGPPRTLVALASRPHLMTACFLRCQPCSRPLRGCIVSDSCCGVVLSAETLPLCLVPRYTPVSLPGDGRLDRGADIWLSFSTCPCLITMSLPGASCNQHLGMHSCKSRRRDVQAMIAL